MLNFHLLLVFLTSPLCILEKYCSSLGVEKFIFKKSLICAVDLRNTL